MNRKIIGASVGTPINPQAIMEKAGIDFKADAIVTSASGEVLTTTDSAKAKPKNIKLFGKGKQEVIPPTNILECTSVDATQYGLTFTHVYKDRCLQYINVNGVVSIVDSGTAFFKVGTITPTEDMEVTFSGAVNGSASTYSFNLQNASNGNYLVDDIGNGSTVVLEGGVTYNAYIVCRSGATLNNVRFYPQIEKGNVKTSYKPFVGNEPSPNMNYPQKAEFLGESGSIGGNVLTGNLLKQPENFVGVIASTYAGNSSEVLLTKAGTYTFNLVLKNATSHYYLAFYDNSNNEVKSMIVTKSVNIDFTQDEANKITHIRTFVNSDFDGYTIDYAMFNYGTEALPYEPYTEQPFTFQTPNGLRGIPLGQTIPDAIKNSPIHMSGVYWDNAEGQYYIGDTENENGKDVQRITEFDASTFHTIKISGDSNWYDSEKSYSYEITYFTGVDGSFINRVVGALCTHLKGYGFSEFFMKGIETGFMNSENYIVVNISKSLGICKTIDEFKQYCIDNDVKFYKILANPIITDTTEEEKAQLDALVMNYPNTTIVNDEGAYMEVEYVADTKCYIDNKFKELAVALANTNANLL